MFVGGNWGKGKVVRSKSHLSVFVFEFALVFVFVLALVLVMTFGFEFAFVIEKRQNNLFKAPHRVLVIFIFVFVENSLKFVTLYFFSRLSYRICPICREDISDQ